MVFPLGSGSTFKRSTIIVVPIADRENHWKWITLFLWPKPAHMILVMLFLRADLAIVVTAPPSKERDFLAMPQ